MITNNIRIIIDAQNDFITGPLGSEWAIKATQRLIEALKSVSPHDRFFVTHDSHSEAEQYLQTLEGKILPVPHCKWYSDGWKLHPDLTKFEEELFSQYHERFFHVSKTTFGHLGWKTIIHPQSDTIIHIYGFCTDICVISNALILRACFPNTHIVIHASCCAGTSEEAHNSALLVARSNQIEIEE